MHEGAISRLTLETHYSPNKTPYGPQSGGQAPAIEHRGASQAETEVPLVISRHTSIVRAQNDVRLRGKEIV